ncbi:LIC14007 family protein [Leptospira kirschneri]|uniref:LIC14007 family protein n=1 Tax=Leptospira kirschneri TaxID=29507 RepID=UPI0002E4BAE1|nr:hypothetical protein [Leptospira kirschneri]EPG51714.1 hypothetical protein LEP1GSC049_2283 [Leptospira kirschneri serovar Cynopteri str. 3522 CT]
MKIYSGDIISSKLEKPFLFVTKNGLKKKILIQEPRKVLETSLANNLEKNVLVISYNLLLDHTGDSRLAENDCLSFSNRFREIFARDSWFFLSNRIETFLKEREQDKFYFHYDSKIKF